MSTRHRNAGGPFTIFNPGLGVTGSLLVEGDSRISGSLFVIPEGVLHPNMGTNVPFIVSQKDQSGVFKGITLITERYNTAGDAYFGLFISSGSNYEQTPATPESAATVNMIAGIRGSDVGKSNAFSFKTQDSAAEVQRVRIQEFPALQVTGSFQNNGNASVTGSLSIMRASSQGTPQLTIHENDSGYGRIEFQNTVDTSGPNSLSHEWTLAGLPKAQGSQADARFNIFYGDQDGSGGGADVLSATGKGNILMPYTCFVSAQLSSHQTDITADDSYHDIIFDQEHFDNQSCYDHTTGIFTAPISGYYLVTLNIGVLNYDNDGGFVVIRTYGSDASVRPRTSNRHVVLPEQLNDVDSNSVTEATVASSSQIVYIPAGQNIRAQVRQNTGTAQMDIDGHSNDGESSMMQIRLLG